MGDLLKGALAPIFEDSSPIPTPNKTETKATPAPKVAEKEEPKPLEKKKLPPPGKPPSLGGLGISVRMKAPAAASATPTKSTTNTVAEKPEANYGLDKLTPDSLRTKWLEFANNQGNMLKQTLGSVIPMLNGTDIQIMLHNGFQKEKVNEVAPSLITFLRRIFDNQELNLTINVSETVASAKAFTPKEKMVDMLNENPALAKLIEKFGLEIE